MIHTIELETAYGRVKATWQRVGSAIVVRYGEREKRPQASETDAANDVVARDVVHGWIAADLREEE
ncbi:hypothetical protein DBIPINDM_006909 [Mesorhizobium sp. AR02]|uniref:hypothetical protein n=1 Tax=Mesorhizobium sp. AR02 TaxID=2865837 RepID=UPI0021609B46|nr:hypothetical protein [Mesorhizobium sp. AR02]UVK53417.1 hypothetical protein DBIPINDM_006909 [Mesorhizobium sp. AR02]